MKMLELIHEKISNEINQLIDFDVSILTINPPLENYVKTATIVENLPAKSKVFHNSSFHSYQILDGCVIINTKQISDDSIILSEVLLNKRKKEVKASLVIPINHELLGSGALFIGSYFNELTYERKRISSLKINSLISKSFETTSSLAITRPSNNDADNYYKQIFLETGSATIIIDENGTIVLANNEFEKLSGYSRIEIENYMTIDDFVPEVKKDNLLTLIHCTGDDQLVLEQSLLRKNSEDRYVRLNIKRLLDSHQFLVNFTDLTMLKSKKIEMREWIERVSMINKIIVNINSNLEFNNSLDILFSNLDEILEYSFASIIIAHPDNTNVQLFNFDKSKPMVFRKEKGERVREYLGSVNSFEGSFEELYQILDIPVRKNYNSEIFLKLHSMNKIVGALCVATEIPNAYSTYHKDILIGISDHVAVTLLKAEYFEQYQKSLRNSEILYKMSQAINQSLNLKNTLETIKRFACEITPAKKCSVEFVNELNKKTLHQQFQQEAKDNKILLIDNCALSAIMKQGTENGDWIKSCCCLPIYVKNELYALIYLYFDKKYWLEDSEKKLLIALAEHSSSAIEKTNQYMSMYNSKQNVDSIIKCSADSIITTDLDGNLCLVNERMINFLGYNKNDILNTSIMNLMINGKTILSQIKNELTTNGNYLNINTEVLKKDGTFVPMSWSFSILRNNDRKDVGYLAIGKDISEQKYTESQIKNKNEELENLIYAVSHNLKTPLVSQEGYISLLRDEFNNKIDKEMLKYITRIEKNAKYMRQMVNDLLLFCKLGKNHNHEEQIDTKMYLNLLVSEMNFNNKIQFHISNELPLIKFDKEELRIIFTNLISNSTKYIGNRENPLIEIDCKRENDLFYFSVKDNGIGIEKQYHDKVFDLFYRLNNVKNIEGTGVGLALVKRIVEKHNGYIRLDSNPEQGTIVTFTIPS